MRGPAESYASHPDFIAFYARIDPALAQFLHDAILHYCDQLPATAWPCISTPPNRASQLQGNLRAPGLCKQSTISLVMSK